MKSSTKSARCKKSIPIWHAAFEEMIPTIETHARISFRHLDDDAREEAIQETVCNACCAYARLVERGKADVARASMLATYSVAQTREGRKVGSSLNIRDISSDYCQKRKKLVVKRLDRYNLAKQSWKEILVADRHAGPSDTAIARIDFAAGSRPCHVSYVRLPSFWPAARQRLPLPNGSICRRVVSAKSVVSYTRPGTHSKATISRWLSHD